MSALPLSSLLLLLLPVVLAACAMGGGRNADLRTEEVTYSAGGVQCTGYLAWDAARTGKRPGVLVVHEWWGHNDYVRQRARMLAELGYTAMALDMYGDGKRASHPADAKKFMDEVLANMSAGKERFEGARRVLASHVATDAAHIAAIGYCFGGAVVLAMARSGAPLDAVASFHGDLSTSQPARSGTVKAKVLVCHGGADQFIPATQVEAFAAEMRAAGVDHDIAVYPGALHGFTSPDADRNGKQFGLPLAYDRAADEQSWQRLRDFLARVWPR